MNTVIRGLRRPVLALLATLPLTCPATAAEALRLTLGGTAQVAFTPGDDADALVVAAIGEARRQILVQAYSLTHRAIAEALVAAQRRRVDVRVIADAGQAVRLETSLVDWLARQGVPVYLDADHAAAHDKVMVIDAGTPEATLITGSFNFTHAAQQRNAENLLLLRGNPHLVEAYTANWRRHKTHALPLRISP